jgi:hypothetical protein
MISWIGIAIAAAGSIMIVSGPGSSKRGRWMAIPLLGLGLATALIGSE